MEIPAAFFVRTGVLRGVEASGKLRVDEYTCGEQVN